MNFPELIRNIAIVGHLHHGKTSFVDMLVNETHSSVAWDVDRQVLY
jgi:U5 small nuclear ribonucleoprotein component